MMKQPLNAFVSFATADVLAADLVRLLLIDLNKQNLSAWIYESIDAEIPTGINIEEACVEKINNCDVFIPIVSKEAFSSNISRKEVRHALTFIETKRFFPIVLILDNAHGWPEPYDKLKKIKYGYNLTINLQESNIKNISEIISKDISKFLGINYSVTSDRNHRLPLKKNIIKELGGTKLIDDKFRTANIDTIFLLCTQFEEEYNNSNFEMSRSLINTISDLISLMFSKKDLYYINIVKGVVEYEFAIANKIIPDHTNNIFKQLIDQRHPQIDENAYAGLATIELMSGYPDLALKNYRKVEKLIGKKDIALHHNILLSKIIAGNDIQEHEVSLLEKYVLSGIVTKQKDNIQRLFFLYLIYLCYMGKVNNAIKLINKKNYNINHSVFDLIGEMINTLLNIVEINHNYKLLNKVISLINHILKFENKLSNDLKFYLYNKKSWILYDQGKVKEAIKVLKTMEKLFPNSIIVKSDIAIMFATIGIESIANNYCLKITSIIDYSSILPVITESDYHFYIGLSYWLLGESKLAKEHFRYTKSDIYYSELYYWIRTPLKTI